MCRGGPRLVPAMSISIATLPKVVLLPATRATFDTGAAGVFGPIGGRSVGWTYAESPVGEGVVEVVPPMSRRVRILPTTVAVDLGSRLPPP